MAAHPLAEVNWFGEQMLGELRQVIPSFMKRVDVPQRGGVWTSYLAANAERMQELSSDLGLSADPAPRVTLVEFDPEGERKVAAAALYATSDLPETQIRAAVATMSEGEIDRIIAGYVGHRSNRRHKPGRAMEQTFYRFDILCDYGIFRDLQRHRMMTLDWQELSPHHGYTTPEAIVEIDAKAQWDEAVGRLGDLFGEIENSAGSTVAQYVVPFANNIRFSMNMNAREAFHMLELRTQQGGHPDYRAVCQTMHNQIRDVAGHKRIADAMTFVDHEAYALGRLETERRAAAKRAALGIAEPSA
jgi:thymidylate synthase ThyX